MSATRKRSALAALRAADGDPSFKRKWDSLDVSLLMEGVLDAFSMEFHGVPFSELSDSQAKRITGAIAAHCIELGRACSPIPYKLTKVGEELAATLQGGTR